MSIMGTTKTRVASENVIEGTTTAQTEVVVSERIIAGVSPEPLPMTSKAGRSYNLFKGFFKGDNKPFYTLTDITKLDGNVTVVVKPYLVDESPVFTQAGDQVMNIEVMKQPAIRMSEVDVFKAKMQILQEMGITPTFSM